MAEFVNITHPDLEGTARASRRAFEEVWKDKGFELADDQPQRAAGEQHQGQVTRGSAQTAQQRREESKKQGEKDES